MVYETKVDWEYEQKCTTSYEKECHGYGYHQECEDVSIDKPNLYPCGELYLKYFAIKIPDKTNFMLKKV